MRWRRGWGSILGCCGSVGIEAQVLNEASICGPRMESLSLRRLLGKACRALA